MPAYKASKSRSQGREGWAVIFRHPVRKDAENKPVRVRRGLGTRDEQEADRLVEQLNQLLQDEAYHSLPQAEVALREGIDRRVVDIFYDDMRPKVHDGTQVREDVIPLPAAQDGYSRVQLLGQTGTGKTTLLRQLIGSNPQRDRFPSTATAKTTTCDIEIILAAEAEYAAVVSFLSEARVRDYVKDCVVAAAMAAASKAPEAEVMRRLLEHVEQRFRLSYILGRPVKPAEDVQDDEDELDDVDDLDDADSMSGEERLDPEVQAELQQKLSEYLKRVLETGQAQRATLANSLGWKDSDTQRQDDEDALLDLLEESLQDNEEVERLVDDIMDDILERFSFLNEEDLQRNRSGWPVRWTFETGQRDRFIKSVNWFTSNYAPNFGKLLTPLVQGVRVRGPFRPEWQAGSDIPRLVLTDGEGLGHTPESVSSVSTSITRRYEQSDVILLVDNAQQPMQAATLAVLKSVCSGGHQSKLSIVFTHLDQVKGDNITSARERQDHVRQSLDNAVGALKETLGASISSSLKRSLDGKIFFVSNIQDSLAEKMAATRAQLARLLEVLQTPTRLQDTEGCKPVYDVVNLGLAVRGAMDEFHQYWRGRLGFGSGTPYVYPEHWSRVKALSRRIAILGEDEYDTLRPVADLIRLLSDHLAPFIANPREWRGCATDDMRSAAVDRIRQEVYSQLHGLSMNRICTAYLKEWDAAYRYKGTGSTRVRAAEIRSIYEQAAPIPGEVPGPKSAELLDEVRKIFREAADTVKADIVNA